MKKTITFASALIFCIAGISVRSIAQNANKNYDEKLARELKADDYGMKKYVLVILKSGALTGLPKSAQDSVFKGHMANINKLAAEGKLIVAGPLGKNDKNYRGIFIFDVDNVEAAKLLVATDPVIKSQIMDAEYYPWYGSAALKETLKIHSKIEKISH
ncbi:MAG TPA: YciI family protein [Pedobacter sp.]|uniref:YciI family protein n=1 Tax=Pedobacter sp. TaxID=1411316 RepID=UPI002C34D128|nr:YciI family protein [Pedobacter sp.]HMI01964.1 YciI family protein [Pedobacter sp.]